jgi:hypothetical protein
MEEEEQCHQYWALPTTQVVVVARVVPAPTRLGMAAAVAQRVTACRSKRLLGCARKRTVSSHAAFKKKNACVHEGMVACLLAARVPPQLPLQAVRVAAVETEIMRVVGLEVPLRVTRRIRHWVRGCDGCRGRRIASQWCE